MLTQDKHRVAMYRLLTGIFRDTYLSAVLGFKGGTACYFFYNLPRFSVDLDFDIIAKKDDATVCEEVFKRVKEIINREGLTIRDEASKRNTVFFHISYEDAEHNIKVEMSVRDYPNTYEIKDFYGLSARVLARQDMFAHKLIAATERKRTASRDFFDIWFFFKQGWPINEDIVKLRTGKNLKAYLGHLREFTRGHFSGRNILQGMGEVVDEKQKIWVKNRLKDELIGIIGFYMDTL